MWSLEWVSINTMDLTNETKGTLQDAGYSYEKIIKTTMVVKFPIQIGSAFTLPIGKNRAIIIAKRYLRDDQWVHEF